MLFSIIGPQTPIVAAVSPNPPSGGIHTVAPQNGGQLHGTGQPAPPAAGPVGVSGGGAPPQKKGKPGEELVQNFVLQSGIAELSDFSEDFEPEELREWLRCYQVPVGDRDKIFSKSLISQKKITSTKKICLVNDKWLQRAEFWCFNVQATKWEGLPSRSPLKTMDGESMVFPSQE